MFMYRETKASVFCMDVIIGYGSSYTYVNRNILHGENSMVSRDMKFGPDKEEYFVLR